MLTVQQKRPWSRQFEHPVAVGRAEEASATAAQENDEERQAAREGWQRVIDYQLIEWARRPEELADEGVEPPAAETCAQAIQLASRFAEMGLTPPTRVVPDANGGIVFERRQGEEAESIHLWDDGRVELCCFVEARLVERRTLQVDSAGMGPRAE